MKLGFDAVNDAISRQQVGSRTPPKVYELYPHGLGFSVKTEDYHGVALSVAATSVRQAYALAYKRVWIDPSHRYPVGIVSEYDRSAGTTLWCGCSGHSVTGGEVRHGAGIRALREAIADHHCDDQRQARP